jgi:hypothetical protein
MIGEIREDVYPPGSVSVGTHGEQDPAEVVTVRVGVEGGVEAPEKSIDGVEPTTG